MSNPCVIVGDGIFGVGLARHRIDNQENDPLIVISSPLPQAPSEDDAKIYRPDYPTEAPMRLAIRAGEAWVTKPYVQYITLVARINIYDKKDIKILDSLDRTRIAVGRQPRERLNGEVLKKYYGGDHHDVVCTYNTDDGLIDLNRYMTETRELVKKRCTVVQKRVKELIHRGPLVVQVNYDDGSSLDTSKMVVVLAAGPWICEILSRSGIELPVGTPQPVGIFAFELELTEISKGDLPIVSHYGRGKSFDPLSFPWLMMRNS